MLPFALIRSYYLFASVISLDCDVCTLNCLLIAGCSCWFCCFCISPLYIIMNVVAVVVVVVVEVGYYMVLLHFAISSNQLMGIIRSLDT